MNIFRLLRTMGGTGALAGPPRFCVQEPSPRHGSLRGRMEGGRPMEPISGGFL